MSNMEFIPKGTTIQLIQVHEFWKGMIGEMAITRLDYHSKEDAYIYFNLLKPNLLPDGFLCCKRSNIKILHPRFLNELVTQ